LLLPAGKIETILQNVKFAVFPNAFTLTDELKVAITKLQSQHRTREVLSNLGFSSLCPSSLLVLIICQSVE
jgi:hypothetical protein